MRTVNATAHQQTIITALEAGGSVLGLIGAYSLATHSQSVALLGWLAFLSANVAMIGFAASIKRYWLLLQQVGFLGSSLLGLVNVVWPS
ncbi:hypothetical protein ACVNIS_24875 (plasmid) [Sphaerotilaceae bacterium SBD11-9]